MIKASKGAEGLQTALGRIFSVIPLSPNQWTVVSFLVALAAAYFIMQQNLLYGAALFGISAFLDAIDGAVARATGRATPFGAFLDGVVDRFAEAAVLLALFFLNFQDSYAYFAMFQNTSLYFEQSKSLCDFAIALFLFLGTCMTAFIRAYAHHRGVIGEEDAKRMGGLFERGERTAFIFVILLLGSMNISWLLLGIYLGIALSAVTVVQRLLYIAGKVR